MAQITREGSAVGTARGMGMAVWIEIGRETTGEENDAAGLLGGKGKPGKALVLLSGSLLQCRAGRGSLRGTLQETQ